jgi:hypothetical protein
MPDGDGRLQEPVMQETIVCVATSERTWQSLGRYCFNAPFITNRHRFDLAIGFNGDDHEGRRFLDGLTPEYVLVRPNTGHDLANFDNIIKNVPIYSQYILLHDDHWFYDEDWFNRLEGLLESSPDTDVFGNLVAYDLKGDFKDYHDRLCSLMGYTDVIDRPYPHFVQGLAGMYRGSAIRTVLEMDGIPHLHRSVQAAAQVFERVFSSLMLNRGLQFEQIPPGFEMYLVHRDHSFVAIKLQQASQHLVRGDNEGAESIFIMLNQLRPDDPGVQTRIRAVRAGLPDPAIAPGRQ